MSPQQYLPVLVKNDELLSFVLFLLSLGLQDMYQVNLPFSWSPVLFLFVCLFVSSHPNP